MKYVNYKKIMLIAMSGFVLTTSCTKTEAKEVEVTYNDENKVYEAQKVTNYTDKDIIRYFKKQKKKIMNSEKTREAKEKAIKSFINMTDFIFYGKEIHGITYDELKEATKENIKDTYFEVDGIIESKFPNYKSEVSSKYNKAKNWLKNKYDALIKKGKENLSDNSIDDIEKTKEQLEKLKDSLKDTSESIYEDGKQKTKSWYEDLKRNHK